MRGVNIKLAAAFIGVLSLLSAAVPFVASANGTCISGGGTGTLVWDTSGCALAGGGGGTGAIRGYDTGVEPTKSCSQITNSQLATKFGSVTNVLNAMKTTCGTVNSGGATTDTFSFIWDNSLQCSASDTYSVCLGKVSVPSQAWPNVTSTGGVWNLHSAPSLGGTYADFEIVGSHINFIADAGSDSHVGGLYRASGSATILHEYYSLEDDPGDNLYNVSATEDLVFYYDNSFGGSSGGNCGSGESRTTCAAHGGNVVHFYYYSGAYHFTAQVIPPPSNCGLGCGGVPTAYKASFNTTTSQTAALGVLSDLTAFVWHYIPYIIVLILSLTVLGLGAYYLYLLGRSRGWDEGTSYSAGEIKKLTDRYK